MPKKHKQIHYKPNASYVHPSLSGSPKGSAQPKPTLSVNEQLSNLRLAQSSPASAERKRELAELSNQRSLPPSLGQGILGLPIPAAPSPRNNHVARSRIRLRTPGPAPPPSWTSQPVAESRYYPARRPARTFAKKSGPERDRPQELARFLNMTGDNSVRPGSLLHSTLHTAAENWSDIVEDCFDSLDVLPVHLRAMLLSYLTSIGPKEGVNMAALQALFPSQSEISYLDLSGLVGWGFSMKELRKWLTKSTEEPKPLTPGPSGEESEILDSWDQDAEDTSHHGLALSSSPTLTTRMQHLTKLSLAFPPPNISWNDLLSLSKDLHTITHLSLAHWPLPTRTPNMTATSYVSNTGLSHPAGATTIYTSLDRDFEESSIVLRQLSENTYCLRWLDLQGCSEWISALTWRGNSGPAVSSRDNDWIASKTAHGPDWNGSWRHVSYINISQGTVPHNRILVKSTAFRRKMAIRNLRLTTSQLRILEDVRLWLDAHPAERESQKLHCDTCHHGDDTECDENCGRCNAYQDEWVPRMARWVEREESGRDVGRGINGDRAEMGRSRCWIDHGWFCARGYPAPVVSRR